MDMDQAKLFENRANSSNREVSWSSDDKKAKTCDWKAHLNKASFMQCAMKKWHVNLASYLIVETNPSTTPSYQ